jgi:glycosyltransferase involved in cell wall biosynthesis
LLHEFPAYADKAVVIREGADPEVFRRRTEASSSVLERLGVRQPPLLAVGTVQPRKNYARLIAAYAGLAREEAPPLVIVGRPGWDYEEVMAMPGRLGIADRVVFTGHLPEEEVAELMGSSMMLCAVSTGEGFGLPLVEAMYSGLPILASDIPPFREVAGNAARFVDPLSRDDIASGLRALLLDASTRSEMSDVGLGRRQLFSWDVAADGIVGALRRALTNL